MSNPPTPLVIAVDGGGTRCRIASSDGDTVVAVETDSANVSTNFDAGVGEILKGVEKLSGRIGHSCDDIFLLPAFIGLAGVTGPDMAKRLQNALPFRHVRIEDDRPAALRGALPGSDGFLVHCGTGSFFGIQIDNKREFVGGWGPVLGDECSAQWIGRNALSATLETVDKIRKKSALTDRLLMEFKGSAGIVQFATHAGPADFGALAPYVTEASANDDPVAIDVMRAGAEVIAKTLGYLDWQPGCAICLTGGIGPFFKPFLPKDMQGDIVAPVGTPLDGAIAMAQDFAHEISK